RNLPCRPEHRARSVALLRSTGRHSSRVGDSRCVATFISSPAAGSGANVRPRTLNDDAPRQARTGVPMGVRHASALGLAFGVVREAAQSCASRAVIRCRKEVRPVRTQVAIIGAGPAGLLLSQLLDLEGIDSVLIERQSAQHVASRIRAGILEASTVEVLRQAGVADRMAAEGLQHRGIYLQWPDERIHIDFTELAGRSVWVYGQTEVTRDLMAAREQAGQASFYEATEVAPGGAEDECAYVSFVDGEGTNRRVDADVVV